MQFYLSNIWGYRWQMMVDGLCNRDSSKFGDSIATKDMGISWMPWMDDR